MSVYFFTQNERRIKHYEKDYEAIAYRCTYPCNLYNWFLSNAQSLVLMAIAVIGVYLGFKREFSKLIGFLVIALIAVGLVFNAAGVKDVLLQLFNKIIGA